MALYTTKTRAQFNEKVLENKKVVLVDFWAAWCAPCRAMAPILDAIAKDMSTQIDVVKVDIEESADNQMIAGEYGVQGIPNMQIFKDGSVVDELIGMRPQAALEDELKAALKK
jgi:thioredoxin 1